MNRSWILIGAAVLLLAQVGCSTREASYHRAQKHIASGDLRFHQTLKVDEYLNAFPQDWLTVPEDQEIVARVDAFNAAQGASLERSILQVAIKTRAATATEARAPLGLAFVIDVSGSMSGEKIDDTRKALVRAIRELNDGDYASLTMFSSGAATLVPATELGRESRERLAGAAAGLEAGGGTNIEAGLVEGYRQMALFPAGITKRLLLLTDGQSNVGTVAPEEIARAARVQYLEGARISTIGLGNDVDERMLRTIAARGNGHYYFAEDGKALTKILREDLRTTVVPVAKDVSVGLQLGQGYVFERIHGAEGVDVGGRSSATIALGELNVNDWRILIVEVKGTGRTQGPELGLSGSYVSPRDGATKPLARASRGEVVGPDGKLSKTDAAVIRNAVLYGNAEALIEASRLDSVGFQADAVRILRTQLNNNAVLASIDNSPMVLKERDNLGAVLNQIEQRARVEPKRAPARPAVNTVTTDRDTRTRGLVREGLLLAAEALPGLWSTVARLLAAALQ